MKNLKKVLAMVLAFACTFSMFAGAKVFEDVKAGSDYSEAITMLSDLGVIQGKDDGKYHPEDTITRAEACAMIARLMTGDPNVSQYVGAQSFVDVAKGSWKDSAIGYCYINGIVVGVGNNKFEPDRAITDAEFVTMVVRAMGYETADMKQNYPFSYMSNAQAMGLLDGVNMVANTDALRGEDAQVIYNALFADYARGAKLVNTTHGTSVETYPTLAESVWGLDRAAVGTWNKKDNEDAKLTNCKAHTWVVLGADPSAENRILAYPIADDKTTLYTEGKGGTYSFKYEGDIAAITGYQVELWGQGKHGQPTWETKNDKYVWSEDWTIKAIKTVKGQTAYDYDASKADSKSDNGTIELGESKLELDSVAANASTTEKIYAVDQFVSKSYNGEKIGEKDDKKVEKALNVRDGAQYKLVDWDSDGDIDWAVVSTANYYKVESVNAKRATVISMKSGDDFESQTKSDSQTWKLDDITEIDGVKYNFKAEDLKQGDIVEVTYTVAYDKGEKGQVVTAKVSKVDADNKKLDKVSTKGGLTLTFGGDEIKVAQNQDKADTIVPANPSTYREFNSEELGTEFALYLNRNGFIVYSDYATETANYAMVLDVDSGSDRTGNRSLAKVDLLLADNSVKKDVELTSGARVQDAAGKDLTAVYDNRKFKNDKMVVGNVYKYWTDADGRITRMQSLFTTDDAKNNDSYEYKSSTDRLTRTTSGNEYVASLEEADVIFAVKTDGSKSFIRGTDNTGDGLYVDAGDVLAVKAKDIPDINKTTDTKIAKLDNENKAEWINNTTATFIANANTNKAGSAAILGVDSFNKFNSGATKIGLVTNVSYSNSSDGKYVEVDVAVNGKVQTLESKKKVDFSDVVEVKDNNDSDPTIKSESTVIQTGVFHDVKGKSIALDKYLEKNAAYAEITTDGDGKVTKVTFLDTEKGSADENKLKGNYYTVTRNVLTENKTKSFNYVDATAHYASEKKLYSVDRMLTANAGIADEAAYYTISARPTRMDGDYKNTQMVVSAGFDGTPKIEAADKASMLTASIDNRYDSDTYYVADIAFNGDNDIAAMFSFTDDMGETEAKDTILIGSFGNNKDENNSTIKAGEADQTIKVTVPNGQSLTEGKIVVKDASGKEVSDPSVAWNSHNLKLSATRAAAAGTYTVEVYGRTQGSTDVVVATFKFTVEAADALVADGITGTEAGGAAKVDASGKVMDINVKAGSTGVTGLTDKDIEVSVDGFKANYTVAENSSTAGLYRVTFTNSVNGKDITVKVGGKSVIFPAISTTTGVTLANAGTTYTATVAAGGTGFTWSASEPQATNAITINGVAGTPELVLEGTGLAQAVKLENNEVKIDKAEAEKLAVGTYTAKVKVGTVESGAITLKVEKQALTISAIALDTGAKTLTLTVNADVADAFEKELANVDWSALLAQANWQNATGNIELAADGHTYTGTSIVLKVADHKSASTGGNQISSAKFSTDHLDLTITSVTPTIS
ncbi:S-layer homology domain-containing protein [Butyricicoccus pullicaecorum]|uniref:SLH domain-containing protein n=1 Tax=Butyricicoccus pullicaecorum 1.2 TaxID=1203606 RepID=R8VXW0_9FIRM|nr:S-layer homology domain-containing protein [Butyricicoccus pullicaecorum]EOQ35767.1 hypothetical protein HMPREF1526_02737 [Butyricicoccus pullicaecorum 1.2]SKA63077.1 S-layer homology domain-containing protein [Butyricicoccus pullicaecorum DSM 23266]